MINSEKIFDILPYVIEIYEKLDIKGFVQKKFKNSKTKDSKLKEDVGREVILYIIKNNSKIKDEFFTVVSIIEDISIEEAKKTNPMKLIDTFKTIFTDEECINFFKSAMN